LELIRQADIYTCISGMRKNHANEGRLNAKTGPIHWLAIAILALLSALGIAAWELNKGKKGPADCSTLF